MDASARTVEGGKVMEDLISRQAAIDVLNKLAGIKYTHMPYYGYYLGALHDAANDIKALPSVQERKKGRWEKAYADHEAFGVRPFYRYCSVCNEVTVFAYSYCPHCGASMMEGAEE